MNLLQRLRHWTMRLPASWGLGQADIHASLLITLGLLSGMLLLISVSRPGFRELQTLAATLPVVWIVSLAVRIAAQQLAIGGYSLDMTTSVGPSGNLSTDYEYLPPKCILAYAAAGQLATCGLIVVGFVVHVAMAPTMDGELRWEHVLDLSSGWGSSAWASQILWINAFIGLLNLLPTVPFDMRAAVFALYANRHCNAQSQASFDGWLPLIPIWLHCVSDRVSRRHSWESCGIRKLLAGMRRLLQQSICLSPVVGRHREPRTSRNSIRQSAREPCDRTLRTLKFGNSI